MQLSEILNMSNFSDTKLLQERFSSAYPFPHICIDNFLDSSFAESLHANFPSSTDPRYADFCREDGGAIGTNYANSDPSTFPSQFRLLDQLFKMPELLTLISEATGIKDVLYDPDYIGGGIRESHDKTALPVHLDFNYHPKTLHHRRMNLLLYLNKDWQRSWGGDIQVHLNPNTYRDNSLVGSFPPIFNRLFIFETSEKSWHGFSQLNVPADRSRRAWSIYYYTQEKADQNQIKIRNTEYVEPGLSSHLVPGYQLTEEDIAQLKNLLHRRDGRIEMLYEMRATMDDKFAHLWNEYEYYLEKFRLSQTQQNLDAHEQKLKEEEKCLTTPTPSRFSLSSLWSLCRAAATAKKMHSNTAQKTCRKTPQQ